MRNSAIGVRTIGVGIIDASAVEPGWATLAHLPAIRALRQYRVTAVSCGEQAPLPTAAASRDRTVDQHLKLIHRPDVDLVVVGASVPYHDELVAAAIDAGRMVSCEWPLGADGRAADALAARAQAADARTMVDLLGRFDPVIRYAHDLVAAGYLGDALATTLVASGASWGWWMDRRQTPALDTGSGAATVSIAMVQTLDALTFLLGEFSRVSATAAIRRSTRRFPSSSPAPVAPDHVAVTGTLQNGALVSAFYRAGTTRGANLCWELNGSEGDLAISGANSLMPITDLRLHGARAHHPAMQALSASASYFDVAPEVGTRPVRSLARAYAQLARDVYEGTRVVPDFARAADHQRLIEAVQLASMTGSAQSVDRDARPPGAAHVVCDRARVSRAAVAGRQAMMAS